MRIEVRGIPKPQGSKSPKGRNAQGHAIVVESCKALPQWRYDVTMMAIEQRQKHGKITGPVLMRATFTMPKPTGAPKKKRTYADKKPDLSKLVRAVEDALTAAGVWEDDARVVLMAACKTFPGEVMFSGCEPLDSPGCVIEILPITEARQL